MAKKSRYFSLFGNPEALDAVGIGKQLKEAILDSAEALVNDEANFVIERLEQLLDEIGQGSPNRGRGFFSVRYNRPIDKENSPIKIRKRINRNTGQYTVSIRVDNRKFNILDLGAPAREASKENPMKFPKYIGRQTQPNSLSASRTVKIIDNRSANQPARKGDIFGPERGRDIPEIIGGWVTTTHVEALQPRNFILQIAKEARNRRTATGRRSQFVKILVKKG